MAQEIRLGQGTDDTVVDLGASQPDVNGFVILDETVVPVQQGLLVAARWRLAVKRVMDVVISGLVIIVLAPFLAAVAVLVKVTSRGPVFFVQQRVGRGGEPFDMIKFRSMYRDAHDRRDEHLVDNIHDGPIFKIREDPRVTAVGRAIRRLSIDELPQLFNVLKGDMSLVGPRPPLPEELLDYTDREMERLLVKPGITCIWQVSGRSDLDFQTWVDMDLEYIDSWSLLLDFKLLAKTLPAVITGRGAY
jgi:exopolysaccharide biosynthesis polyprenyl glycosylphosphotransferase